MRGMGVQRVENGGGRVKVGNTTFVSWDNINGWQRKETQN